MGALGPGTGSTSLRQSQEVASERRVGPTYWEGAIRVQGTADKKPINGSGYLEMTGYDKKLSWGESVE